MLKRIATIGTVLLLVVSMLLATLIKIAQPNANIEQQRVRFAQEVKDTPYVETPEEPIFYYPPLYFQTDTRWADYPYANNTIDESGCGLCVFASVLSYYEQADIVPTVLADMVGNTCLVYGDEGQLVNDIGLFIEWAGLHYPNVKGSEMYWDPEIAISSLAENKLVIASVNGTVGSESYGGHLVLLYNQNDGIAILDPKSESNSGMLTLEEFNNADWFYFYTIEERTD